MRCGTGTAVCGRLDVVGAVRVLGCGEDTDHTAVGWSPRENTTAAMGSVRARVAGARAVVGKHRSIAAWPACGGTGRDPGGQADMTGASGSREMTESAVRRVVRVIPGGPMLVEGPVRIELPDGAVVESDRFMVAICA